jgi:two-component sensor histidine kinase
MSDDRIDAVDLHHRGSDHVGKQVLFGQERLRELRHRIKNDLQKLSSMLSLQSNQTHYPECTECVARVNSIAQLHVLLNEDVGTSKDGPKPETISIAAYLQSVTDGTQAAFGGHFTIETSFDPDLRLNPRRSALVGLILNEAIMNALKHAFPNGSEAKISASFHQEGESFGLSVCDNGVGFHALAIKRGLGTQLMRGLAQQLGGEVAQLGAPEGTTVRLSFPV